MSMPSVRARMGSLSRYEQILLALFILTIPLVNPWVRGDGVGYYAYARALLIQRNLRFEQDWLRANRAFVMNRTDAEGHIVPEQYTATGHLDNHFSVGPAILWSPFLIVTHLGVLGYNAAGGKIPADGFSWPYTGAMAVATAFYGFLGLWISFHLAREYVEERWAFLATLGVWFGSSLIVYMYFNPSWSHAHSAFVVALFLWYWFRTRSRRTLTQWLILGLISGLLLDVYYPNGVLLLVPLLEALTCYRQVWREPDRYEKIRGLFLLHLLYAMAILIAFLPTLITRRIIYGSAFQTGYYSLDSWHWTSPSFWQVLFSSNHGLFSWTPILLLSTAGLFLFLRRDATAAKYLLAPAITFYYLITSYDSWDGISSFGNRFFVSLTPIFIIGLAIFFDDLKRIGKGRRGAAVGTCVLTGIFIVWNLGFVYQWGMHLIPDRGPISWRQMANNQFRVVPVEFYQSLKHYLSQRKHLMYRIEEMDIEKLRSQEPKQQ
jgi:hypothetical protein